MTKPERHALLLQQLPKNQQAIPLSQLAEWLNCSERTIRRDIEELVSFRHAPWFILGGNVYLDCSRKHQIEVEGYWFTSEELFSLLALYQMVDSLSEGLLSGHFLDFKQRILQLLGPKQQSQNLTRNVKIIPIASPPIDNNRLNKVTEAIANQQQLKIEFWNRHQDIVTERNISPYQLVRYRDRWFIDAFCHKRNALRSFSVEAIIHISPLNRDAIPPNENQLKTFYQSSYGIFNGKATQVAILNFSAYQARWIKEQQWHPQQTATWLDDGRYQLQLLYNSDPELIQDILKFGPEVEVISPPELRRKVIEQLQKTLSCYRTGFS